MDYNLTPGINLDNRKIYFNIPSGTTISGSKVIIQTDNANNYIGENTTGGYYHYVEDGDEVVTYFYDSNTNLSNVVLPDGFGTIIEVDTTATLYEYITRKSHEKMYAHSEDFDKRETLDIDGIKAEVEEQARSYGVPIDSIFGFDGIPTDIPGGYELSNESFGGGLPTGGVCQFAGSTAPSGYLICDGSAISRTEYASLFGVIGTAYGVGDGSTTFNIPNIKSKTPVGLDSNDTDFNTLGNTGGEKTHTLTESEMPVHYHERIRALEGNQYLGKGTGSKTNVVGTTFNTGQYDYTDTTNNNYATGSAGGGLAHNNMQPFIVMNYIIKY